MDIITLDDPILSESALEEEAKAFESGDWTDGITIRNSEPRQVNVTLPAWVVVTADAEAARINVSRRAVLNYWIAEKAEQTLEKLQMTHGDYGW